MGFLKEILLNGRKGSLNAEEVHNCVRPEPRHPSAHEGDPAEHNGGWEAGDRAVRRQRVPAVLLPLVVRGLLRPDLPAASNLPTEQVASPPDQPRTPNLAVALQVAQSHADIQGILPAAEEFSGEVAHFEEQVWV